jgi:hypothetical protein
VRGPPLTIRCECGETKSLRYGERWTCERCGRRWNTDRIPVDEYRGLVRDLRRYRLEAVGAAVAIVAVLIPLALLVNAALVFAVPLVLAFAAIFYGPRWKRKVRRRIASRPRWELHPE